MGSEQGSEWNSVNISIQRQDLAAIRIHAQTHVSARSDGDIAIDDVTVRYDHIDAAPGVNAKYSPVTTV